MNVSLLLIEYIDVFLSSTPVAGVRGQAGFEIRDEGGVGRYRIFVSGCDPRISNLLTLIS